jgi:hypothetical protein
MFMIVFLPVLMPRTSLPCGRGCGRRRRRRQPGSHSRALRSAQVPPSPPQWVNVPFRPVHGAVAGQEILPGSRRAFLGGTGSPGWFQVSTQSGFLNV